MDESGDPATAALISSARELFTERGYAGVRTEEIVARAGVTQGALYDHFRGGKEDLFRAVLVGLTGEIAGRVRTAAQRSADPWDALVIGIDVFLDACAAPEMRRILLVDGPLVLGWDMWRAIDEHYAHRVIEAALQRAIDAVLDLPAQRIGVIGLAFKEDTDDLRESPAVTLLEQLIGKGRDVKVFDSRIRLDSIYGSNRNFILETIPHIGRLLTGSLDEILAWADHLVLVQKQSPEAMQQIQARGTPLLGLLNGSLRSGPTSRAVITAGN